MSKILTEHNGCNVYIKKIDERKGPMWDNIGGGHGWKLVLISMQYMEMNHQIVLCLCRCGESRWVPSGIGPVMD